MTILKKEELPGRTQSALEMESSFTPPAGWDEFVLKHTGCIYHGTSWHKTLETGYRAKTIYLYARQNGELQLGIAGTVYYFLFFKIFFSAVPYGGFIGHAELLPRFLNFFEIRLRQLGIHQIRVTRVARYPFEKPEGYRERRAFQHLLDLAGQTPESLWEGYRKNNRRDVNKAVRSGVKIVQGRSEEDLKAYEQLYDATMSRNRSLRFYPRSFLETIYKDWAAGGRAEILFAEYEGKKIAASLLVYSGDTTYLLGNVSSYEFLKLCPNDLLTHEALVRTLAAGRRYFDFMMSDEKDAALVRFKEKWGAQSFDFFIYEKDLSRLRSKLWRLLWKIASSPFGVKLLAFLKK